MPEDGDRLVTDDRDPASAQRAEPTGSLYSWEGAGYDELFRAQGEPREHARRLIDSLAAIGAEGMTTAGRRRDGIFIAQGITFDPSGITASPISFTINTTGTYAVSFTGDAGGPVRLRVNAVGVGPQVTPTSFSRILSLNAGDVIDVVSAGVGFEHDDPGTGITIMRIA